MGNTQSKAELEVVGNQKEPDLWKDIENIGYCEVVTNIETGEVAESYTVPVDGRIKLQREYEIYQYRRVQCEHLVKVYQVIKKNPEYLCSGVEFMKVKTERIPYRLNEIKQLTIPEVIYTLYAVSTACKKIKQLNGPVKIDSNMIGINQKGEIKVWLNENFAKNHPQMEYEFDPQTSAEEAQIEMVAQTVQCVKNQVKSELPKQVQQIFTKKFQTFDQLLEICKTLVQRFGLNLNNIWVGGDGSNNKGEKVQFFEPNNETYEKQQNKSKILELTKSKEQDKQPFLSGFKQVAQIPSKAYTLTTYTVAQIPQNTNTSNLTNTNHMSNSKGKPPRPTSASKPSIMIQSNTSRNGSQKSSSRQNSRKSTNYTNIQTVKPKQNPLGSKSASPLKYSNSQKSIGSPEEGPQVKPYIYEHNKIETNSILEKHQILDPFAFPYTNGILFQSQKPSEKQPPKMSQFSRPSSKQKTTLPYNSFPLTWQKRQEEHQEPSFAPLSKPNTPARPINSSKILELLNERMDLNAYKLK